jgi:CRP-like cAMP-binding protein
MSIEKIIPIIEQISLLGGIDKKGVKKIVHLAKFERVKAGQTLFRRGDLGDQIYIILSGKIVLTLDLGDEEIDWITLRSGDCCGEEATIGIQQHSVSAVCRDQAEVMVLSDQNLMKIYESDSHLFSLLILNIAREVCRRLNHSNQALAEALKTHQLVRSS